MITLLLKHAKEVLTIILASIIILTSGDISNADYTENTHRDVDIVIRSGEWQNNNNAKPGKRYNWGNEIDLSTHGINIKDVPSDIPLRKGEDGFFISEADINLKTARAIARKLDLLGADVDLQYSESKSTDLNAAGEIADNKNPKIYLSIHHNSYKVDSSGYFFITNEGDVLSSEIASRLSDSISENGYVPKNSNRVNKDSYIGELNHVSKSGRISILSELGYFSNPNELIHIMSDDYVDMISTKIANELFDTLSTMDVYHDTTLQETYENARDEVILQFIDSTSDKTPITIMDTQGEEIVIGYIPKL